MGSFFNTLVSENLIRDWADVLDWIFDDNRFPAKHGWNRGYVSQFTKRVKNLPGVLEGYKSVNAAFEDYPKSIPKKNSNPVQIIANFSGESEAKGIVRHIRNGIAHGNTNYKRIPFNKQKELFIEIKDYKKDGKKQTAYILFPIRYIVEINKIYKETESSIRNCKLKGRKK